MYRADGLKIKKTYGTKVTDYLDGFQYETIGTTTTLQFIPTAEDYYDFSNSRYTYNYTDHLGNVRLSYYKSSTGALSILEENNYYPFGLKHTGYNSLAGNPAYKLGYNGKELQETGQIDYGARFYMPDIGRWGVVDPLAEKMTRHSPYNYAYNNPIRFIDPDGRDPDGWGKKGDQWEWNDKVTADNYQSMGYSDFSDGYTNNTYSSDQGLVTLGPNGANDWSVSSFVNNNTPLYFQSSPSLSYTRTSFNFTTVNTNIGFNFGSLNGNLNFKVIDIRAGFSIPGLIGNNNSLQAYLAGTLGEGKLSSSGDLYNVNLSSSIAGRVLTGNVGVDSQWNNNGFSFNGGMYGAIAEVEGSWGISSKSGRWGANATYTIPIGAEGATGGLKLLYNPNNDTFNFGVAGKAAEILGLGIDLEFTYPNPFNY